MKKSIGKHSYQVANPINEGTPQKDRSIVLRFAVRLNIARPICRSLFGEEHSVLHHMVVGLVIMVIGVAIAKVAGHHPNTLVAGVGDLGGYAIHGIGLTPFVEFLAKLVRNEVA